MWWPYSIHAYVVDHFTQCTICGDLTPPFNFMCVTLLNSICGDPLRNSICGGLTQFNMWSTLLNSICGDLTQFNMWSALLNSICIQRYSLSPPLVFICVEYWFTFSTIPVPFKNHFCLKYMREIRKYSYLSINNYILLFPPLVFWVWKVVLIFTPLFLSTRFYLCTIYSLSPPLVFICVQYIPFLPLSFLSVYNIFTFSTTRFYLCTIYPISPPPVFICVQYIPFLRLSFLSVYNISHFSATRFSRMIGWVSAKKEEKWLYFPA